MTSYTRMKEMAQIRQSPPKEMILQKYITPTERDACQNCKHCVAQDGNKPYKTPIHRHCGVGGFPVSPNAICDLHERNKK